MNKIAKQINTLMSTNIFGLIIAIILLIGLA